MQRSCNTGCQVHKTCIMKYLVIMAIVLVTPGFLCSKKGEDNTSCPTELTITSTQPPATVAVGSDIVAKAKCYGPDLCYSFSHVEIKTASDRVYEIRTKGTIPCKAAICAQALYQAEPSFTIKTTLTGQYILRYYNNNTLFKADTVTVN